VIYDYVDESLPTLQRMYQRRSKGYDAMGYTIIEGADDGLVQVNMEFSEKGESSLHFIFVF